MEEQRAVVVGGGIAGLVTARVLADHFSEVVLIERDEIPLSPQVRGGVPQGNHFHAILAGGLEIMMQLFPGFEAELEARGSLVPEPSQFYFFRPEGKSFELMRFRPEPIAPLPGFPKLRVQTRALLEHTLRRRVEAVPNIRTRYHTMVRDPVFDGARVIGVQIDGTDETLRADLVIDATGRVSRCLSWLDAIGFERPAESHVNCDFAYTSVFLRPKDPTLFQDVGFFVAADPDSEHPFRGGALVRMEGGTWLALIGGRLGDHPPKTMDGFMAYAATLIEPWFHELLTQAEPVSSPHHFKFPRSIRRHYERLTRFPAGLLPIGDAISHYNPVYGQGMSVACRQAIALGALIAQRRSRGADLDGLWQPFFAAAFEQTRAPWLLAALADFASAGTTGDFPNEEMASVELFGRLGALADSGDQQARILLASVVSMRAPLSTLHDWQARQAAQ